MSDELLKILHEYIERHNAKGLADRLGMKHSRLLDLLNPDHRYQFPLRLLVKFIEASDYDFTLLDHIENRLGRVAVSLSRDQRPVNHENLCRFVTEFSEAVNRISEAMRDNRITPREASECIRELTDMMQIAAGLIQSLKRIEESDSSS